MKHLLLTTIAGVLLVTTAFADPIHDAAEKGDLARVQKELDKGVDVNATKKDGTTPLHHAAGGGHKEIAELLINKGADVNAKDDEHGETPLLAAAWEGHKEVVELLIANGADVNTKNEYGWSLLHLAIDDGHKEIVELLITAGADVNAKDEDGWTPLDWVEPWEDDTPEVKVAKKETANLLRKHGGKTGAELSIHKAAEIGNIEAVKDHLEAGVNVNARDRYRGTPLDVAEQVDKNASPEIIAAKKEIAKLLRENGAMTSEELSAKGSKLLDAIWAGNIEAVKESLAAGAEVNYWAWVFPLGVAAWNGHTDIVELLINEGANMNMHAGTGDTALHDAARNGNVEIAILLLDAGADVNDVNNPERTPLHNAAQNGHKEVVELLITNGSDVNARDWY